MAFWLGIQAQKLRGYHYQLYEEKEVPFGKGSVLIQYISETVGLPFLDPGTTVVTLKDYPGSEVIIYKARRVFQESYPFVSDVTVNKGLLEWEDGERRYQLNVSALPKPPMEE